MPSKAPQWPTTPGQTLGADCAVPVLMQHSQSSITSQAVGDDYRYVQVSGQVQPFVVRGRAWVGAGPPVGGPNLQPSTAAAELARSAQRAHIRVSFFGVDAQFAQEAQLAFLPLGELHTWRADLWAQSNRAERSIGAQLRRAARHGVRIVPIEPGDGAPGGPLWPSLCALIRGWQARHAMPAMAFVVGLHLHRPRHLQKLYGAFCDGRLVAFAVVLPVGQKNVLIEHIVRHRRAPNGTAEALVDAVMLAYPHAQEATLGLVPLSGPLPKPLRWARRLGQPLYNFAGLSTFKRKLRPHGTLVLGLAYQRGRWPMAPVRALLDLLLAFAGGSLSLFALRLLLRGPQPVLFLLAALLPVWTFGLWCLPTALWFVSPWVQWAWVGFDITLFAALCATLHRPTPNRLGALAGVVAIDTAVTLLEALAYPGPKTLIGLLMHGAGVLAPGASALLLWGAWRRAITMSADAPFAVHAAPR